MKKFFSIDEFVLMALCVPFVDKGRNYEGWDCWGLVRAAYRDIYGITIPDYTDYDSTNEYNQLNKLINQNISEWQVVTDRQPGDIALFTVSGLPVHVAMVIDKRNALHAEQKLGTFVEAIDGAVWGKRLEGIYRYNGK